MRSGRGKCPQCREIIVVDLDAPELRCPYCNALLKKSAKSVAETRAEKEAKEALAREEAAAAMQAETPITRPVEEQKPTETAAQEPVAEKAAEVAPAETPVEEKALEAQQASEQPDEIGISDEELAKMDEAPVEEKQEDAAAVDEIGLTDEELAMLDDKPAEEAASESADDAPMAFGSIAADVDEKTPEEEEEKAVTVESIAEESPVVDNVNLQDDVDPALLDEDIAALSDEPALEEPAEEPAEEVTEAPSIEIAEEAEEAPEEEPEAPEEVEIPEEEAAPEVAPLEEEAESEELPAEEIEEEEPEEIESELEPTLEEEAPEELPELEPEEEISELEEPEEAPEELSELEPEEEISELEEPEEAPEELPELEEEAPEELPELEEEAEEEDSDGDEFSLDVDEPKEESPALEAEETEEEYEDDGLELEEPEEEYEDDGLELEEPEEEYEEDALEDEEPELAVEDYDDIAFVDDAPARPRASVGFVRTPTGGANRGAADKKDAHKGKAKEKNRLKKAGRGGDSSGENIFKKPIAIIMMILSVLAVAFHFLYVDLSTIALISVDLASDIADALPTFGEGLTHAFYVIAISCGLIAVISVLGMTGKKVKLGFLFVILADLVYAFYALFSGETPIMTMDVLNEIVKESGEYLQYAIYGLLLVAGVFFAVTMVSGRSDYEFSGATCIFPVIYAAIVLLGYVLLAVLPKVVDFEVDEDMMTYITLALIALPLLLTLIGVHRATMSRSANGWLIFGTLITISLLFFVRLLVKMIVEGQGGFVDYTVDAYFSLLTPVIAYFGVVGFTAADLRN